jgi:methionine--tRNA ligase beta chain
MNNIITIDDFAKVDIRIGTVVDASVPEWSHWVMKLRVDFGEEVGERTIFSGIMKYYKPEEMIGKQFPFVINLEPKKIGPERELSEGMLMAASVPIKNDPTSEDNERPILMPLTTEVPNGSKVI